MSESQVFTHALKLASPAERAAYLDEVCAGNAELRAAVEALLHAHADDPGFLEQPAGSLWGTVDEPVAPALEQRLALASGTEYVPLKTSTPPWMSAFGSSVRNDSYGLSTLEPNSKPLRSPAIKSLAALVKSIIAPLLLIAHPNE